MCYTETMLYDENKEKYEALRAGRRALDSLYDAKDCLNSASNWGIVDLLGGGMFSSMLKQSKVQDARRCVERAKRDLYTFSKELQDVRGMSFPDIDMDGFVSFADIFFDNFLVDMFVQNKMSQAKRQVQDAIYQVEMIVEQLEKN